MVVDQLELILIRYEEVYLKIARHLNSQAEYGNLQKWLLEMLRQILKKQKCLALVAKGYEQNEIPRDFYELLKRNYDHRFKIVMRTREIVAKEQYEAILSKTEFEAFSTENYCKIKDLHDQFH